MENSTRFRKIAEITRDVLMDAARRFGDDQCLRMAASLSYTSLLAVVPLTAIAFSMLAAFPVFEGVRDSFQTALFANFLPAAAHSMREYLDQFVRNTAALSAVGIVGLALTAILLLSTIESALNTIFRVARTRGLGPRLLVFWTVITLGPLLLGASFSLSTYFFAATEWLGAGLAPGIIGKLTLFAPTLILMVLLALFYITIPNRPVGCRGAIAGAVAAGLMIALLRKVFGLYVASFPTYENIYGALSALPIFLIWMYLSWSVVLFGAVLTATIGEWQANGGRAPRSFQRPGSKLTIAVSVLAALNARRKRGGGAAYRRLLSVAGTTDESLERLLMTLGNAGYVERTARDHWVLARDLEAVTLHDLYRTLGLDFEEEDITLGGGGWRGRLREQMTALRDRNQSGMGVVLAELLDESASPVNLEKRRREAES